MHVPTRLVGIGRYVFRHKRSFESTRDWSSPVHLWEYKLCRGIAQSGQSAAFGTQRFPRFESLCPDHYKYSRIFLDSSAAEPRTVNALVGGSIPSRGANFIAGWCESGFLAVLNEIGIVGSNPTPAINSSYANLANQPTEIVACFSLKLHVYCASAA